ncbi:hypothetical protein [Microbacterium sp. SD291]|uniref:hypothetical protein n=1 Tax=Microbacterium sp. SD291 TaxID=2782007 RepID=UPI001A9727C5|nr:hypothetical protein [Microbacterium sp. SD291]MBO0979098.1 hypothetical protein [Microbacterium sp. SD291]
MSDPREPESSADPLLPEEEDAVEEGVSDDVPAGGAGADSGAVDAVRVDPEDEAEIPDRSAHNDEPGVGTRGGRESDSGA